MDFISIDVLSENFGESLEEVLPDNGVLFGLEVDGGVLMAQTFDHRHERCEILEVLSVCCHDAGQS